MSLKAEENSLRGEVIPCNVDFWFGSKVRKFPPLTWHIIIYQIRDYSTKILKFLTGGGKS